MANLTRTTGPWSVRRLSPGDWQVVGAKGEDVTVVADVENAEGDAHLMAAGPELLAGALRMRCHLCNWPLDEVKRRESQCPMCRYLRAAIAKAEGRVP